MFKKSWLLPLCVALVALLIPIEHKYDKLFRYVSLTLIPEGLFVSSMYEKKIYFYLSDLFAILLFFTGVYQWKKVALSPLVLFFACALFSIVVSPFFAYPLPYFKLLHLATPVLLFTFFTNLPQEKKAIVTKAFFIALLIGGVFQAVCGITQYFSQDYLGLRLLGEVKERAAIPVKGGLLWLLDGWSHSAGRIDLLRSQGTLPHVNVYGGFLLLTLIANYVLFLRARKGAFFLGILIPLQLFALFLSYSRSALLAWAIATFFFFLFPLLRREFRKRASFLFATLAISFLCCSILLFQQLQDRGGVVQATALSKEADAVRIKQQSIAAQIIQHSPFFGLGFSQFAEHAQPFYAKDADSYTRSTAPHNIFLFMACEMGLIALGCFLWWIATLLLQFVKARRNLESVAFFSLFIAYLFIGLCDFYPLLFQQGKLMFFLTAAFLGMHTTTCNQERPVVISSPSHAHSRKTTLLDNL